MEINAIVKKVNSYLAGELLSYNELVPMLDNIIDDINTQLGSCYPVFSEMPAGKTNYDYFPDKFIRTVVVPGATWKYLVVDEEGIPTASQFQADYNTGLFFMQRDMIYNIPVEYQVDALQGSVSMELEQAELQRGLYIDGNNYTL